MALLILYIYTEIVNAMLGKVNYFIFTIKIMCSTQCRFHN